jgi:hypothetical protein
MRVRAVVALVALQHVGGVARAQIEPKVDPAAPTITTRADRAKVQLGEPFHLVITVIHKPDMKVELPASVELGEGFAEMAARTQTSAVEKDGLVKTTLTLTLGALETGTQTVPGLALGYSVKGEHRQITTSAVSLEVSTVVGSGKEELRPAAQPVTVLERDLTLLWVAAGVVGAGLLAFAVWLLLRKAQARRPGARARSGKTAPPLPPDEAALARLRALASSGKLDAEDRRPVYFELSEILREYLGARYGFDALELTTEELLAALGTRAPADVVAEVGEWLRAGDLVKYARVPSGRDEAAAALAQAVTLVERTRPVVTTASAAAASAEPAAAPPSDGASAS